MSNSYKSCKIQDNTAELIYENGSLFVTIFENNIVHVAQKPGIESVAIEDSYIPTAAAPKVQTAAEAGVRDTAVKEVISAKDIVVNVKDNEKLDIYYNGKLVLSDYENVRKKSEKNPYEDLAVAELEGHTVGKDESSSDAVTIVKKLGKDDAIYGLGGLSMAHMKRFTIFTDITWQKLHTRDWQKMMMENVRLYLQGQHMPEARNTVVAGQETITAYGRI